MIILYYNRAYTFIFLIFMLFYLDDRVLQFYDHSFGFVPQLANKFSFIDHFRIVSIRPGWAHSQRRVGVNITIPLH